MSDVYEKVSNYLKKWCDRNYYTDFCVRIIADGIVQNEIVVYEDGDFIFEHDWYEGQEVIILMGFTPVDEINISYMGMTYIKGKEEAEKRTLSGLAYEVSTAESKVKEAQAEYEKAKQRYRDYKELREGCPKEKP